MRVLLLISILLISIAYRCDAAEPWQLTQVTGHLPDLHFSLTDDNGHLVTEKNFRGDIVLLYFGYTNCPVDCPAMMNRLANILQTLGKDNAHMQVLFVTVNPEHDTPAVLHHYIQAFDPMHMTGLTGSVSDIDQMAQRYRAVYSWDKAVPNTPTYIAHSESVYLFNALGHAQLIATTNDTDANIIHDLHGLAHESD